MRGQNWNVRVCVSVRVTNFLEFCEEDMRAWTPPVGKGVLNYEFDGFESF